MRACLKGGGPVPKELAETLYRERFSLSWRQMQDEPADAVGYWLALEHLRAEEEHKQHRTRHG